MKVLCILLGLTCTPASHISSVPMSCMAGETVEYGADGNLSCSHGGHHYGVCLRAHDGAMQRYCLTVRNGNLVDGGYTCEVPPEGMFCPKVMEDYK